MLGSQISLETSEIADHPPVVVMKFGGSCLLNSSSFQKISEISLLYNTSQKIYIASALNGVTNKLIQLTAYSESKSRSSALTILEEIKSLHISIIVDLFNGFPTYEQKAIEHLNALLSELLKVTDEILEFGLEPYFSDFVLSFGEKLSTFILHLYLQKEGLTSYFFSGEDVIITNDNFSNALPDLERTKSRYSKKIIPLLFKNNNNSIVCITGFIGRNKQGYTTTLGRGGSDFTAAIAARVLFDLLKSPISIILWKDVQGILSGDPKDVENPHLIQQMSYSEAKEMSFFGAKVLHPKCLSIVEEQNIEIQIRNFTQPFNNQEFSTISNVSNDLAIMGVSAIKDMDMITVSSGILVDVPGILGKIFTLMGKNLINVSMVTQSSSEVNTTFVVEAKDGQKSLQLFQDDSYFAKWFKFEKLRVGMIAVVGTKIKLSKNKILVFQALDKIGIHAISVAQSSDGINLTLLVPSEKTQIVINAINEEFRGTSNDLEN